MGRPSSEDAADRMMGGVMGFADAWWKERISVSTSEAMQAMKARGEYTGGFLPYGFRVAADGVHLEEDPGEQEVIEAMKVGRERGCSLRAIAKALDVAGYRARSGKRISKSQVFRALAAEERRAAERVIRHAEGK